MINLRLRSSAKYTDFSIPLGIERAWEGDVAQWNSYIGQSHRFGEDKKILFICAFSNVCVVETRDSLVMIDTGIPAMAKIVEDNVRQFCAKRVSHCIYTHGHVDHASWHSLPFDNESTLSGHPPAQIVAQKNVSKRFDRYKLTEGYNNHINQVQFQTKSSFPAKILKYPDIVYHDHLQLEVGDEVFELYHRCGETDDATIVWCPQRKVLFPGDFWTWAAPNCGNPQKVQRYPKELSEALKWMASLKPELVLPGHGPPICGQDRIQTAFLDVAAYLDNIIEQTLQLINKGCKLNKIINSVKIPTTNKPYLWANYDDPRFIVCNIWRLYAGWWDQNPAHLLPADDEALAKELSALVGGPLVLAKRAEQLSKEGKLALASHLVEYAAMVLPKDLEVHRIRKDIYQKRHDHESSLMAQSIFKFAHNQSDAIVKAKL